MFTKSLAAALLLGGAALAASAADAPAKMAGGVLVGPNGMALYTFDKDMAGNGKSVCNGPCAALWPPLMAAATDQPLDGYTLATRDDGGKQWAYKASRCTSSRTTKPPLTAKATTSRTSGTS